MFYEKLARLSVSKRWLTFISKHRKDWVKGLSVRPAEATDYKSVMEIKEDKYGMDYLPSCYHSILQNKKKFCHVACLEEKIIGFTVIYVVDENTTLCGQSGRIMDQYEGMGIMSMVMSKIVKVMLKDFLVVPELVYSTNHTKAVAKAIQWNKKITHTYEKQKVAAVIETKQLNNVMASMCMLKKMDYLQSYLSSAVVLNADDAIKALELLDNPLDFIPEGRWYIPYDIYKPTLSNYGMFFKESSFVPKCVISLSDDIVHGLSFGTYHPCARGLKYNVIFYHNRKLLLSENDLENYILSHVINHLQIIQQISKEMDTYFWVYVATDVNKGHIEDFLFNELNFKHHDIDIARSRTSIVVASL